MAYTTSTDLALPRLHHFSDLDRPGMTRCGIAMPAEQLALRAPSAPPTICSECERMFKQRNDRDARPPVPPDARLMP